MTGRQQGPHVWIKGAAAPTAAGALPHLNWEAEKRGTTASDKPRDDSVAHPMKQLMTHEAEEGVVAVAEHFTRA